MSHLPHQTTSDANERHHSYWKSLNTAFFNMNTTEYEVQELRRLAGVAGHLKTMPLSDFDLRQAIIKETVPTLAGTLEFLKESPRFQATAMMFVDHESCSIHDYRIRMARFRKKARDVFGRYNENFLGHCSVFATGTCQGSQNPRVKLFARALGCTSQFLDCQKHVSEDTAQYGDVILDQIPFEADNLEQAAFWLFDLPTDLSLRFPAACPAPQILSSSTADRDFVREFEIMSTLRFKDMIIGRQFGSLDRLEILQRTRTKASNRTGLSTFLPFTF